jgi:ATP-dependent DNA helicase RecG
LNLKVFPKSLQKHGFKGWDDLLFFFPFKYEDQSQITLIKDLSESIQSQIQLTVKTSNVIFRKRKILSVEGFDESGVVTLKFFHFNYRLQSLFKPSVKLRIIGIPKLEKGGFEFVHPRINIGWLNQQSSSLEFLVPFYKIDTKIIQQETFRRYVRTALENIPKEWINKTHLKAFDIPFLDVSIREIHFPRITFDVKKVIEEMTYRTSSYWKRIKFDELAGQQIILKGIKKSINDENVVVLLDEKQLSAKLLASLSFTLTDAQQKVWSEVKTDLQNGYPTHRLIQGDVGCGKTVIAGMALALALGSGVQAAIMAPSEILANQLFTQFEKWFTPLGIKIIFLSGGLSAKKKIKATEEIKSGETVVVVGTHALIQKEVRFPNLGLSIIDEQHRFGIEQRALLREDCPHILGMSATPIPRSLAMTFLADLNISTVTGSPPNRKTIVTKLVSAGRKDEILERIKVFIRNGGQAFWVCPMINETTDSTRALNALVNTEGWLKENLPYSISVLHGKMTSEEKVRSMTEFRDKKTRVLLATTVIEVGVDVPEAGLIIIENSERFGLAQLHQLRGRVGRGEAEATCILLYEEGLTEEAKMRLKILYETCDGFKIAKRDLEIRGPGEILGTRQAGDVELEFSDLTNDVELVKTVVKFVNKIYDGDKDGEQFYNSPYAPALVLLRERWKSRKFLLEGT